MWSQYSDDMPNAMVFSYWRGLALLSVFEKLAADDFRDLMMMRWGFTLNQMYP